MRTTKIIVHLFTSLNVALLFVLDHHLKSHGKRMVRGLETMRTLSLFRAPFLGDFSSFRMSTRKNTRALTLVKL